MDKAKYKLENFHLASEENNKIIRVVVCSYPGIFSDIVINELNNNPDIKVTGLVYSQRIYSSRENWFGGAIRMIKTSGIDYAILQFMQTDCYLLLRKLSLTKKIGKDVQVLHTKDINTESGLQFLKDLNPDVILLANFNQKVSGAVISIPSLACLNIHPSALPKYKGVDPVFAALYANETSLGVSVHQVDNDFDTGKILAQSVISADQGFSVFYYQVKLFREGGKLAAKKIKQLVQGDLVHIENMPGHYDSWPTKAKICEYKKNGGHLIRYAEYLATLKKELCEA